MSRPDLRRVVPLVLAAVVVASGCGATSGRIDRVGPPRPVGSSGADGSLAWGSCDDDDIDVPDGTEILVDSSGVECARLAVPLEPRDPDGRLIELALARLPATGTEAEYVGPLVVNPGGPGGSGLSMAALASLTFPNEITDRFDIVGFDPRGLGESTPLNCLDEARRVELATGEPPADPAASADQAVELEAEVADGCREADAELFERMGTSYVVDDLEAIRVALGDEPLRFLGLSYGTRIGALYATRYPDQVGALVLDGAVTPDRSAVELLGDQQEAIRRAFDRFVAGCATQPGGCPMGDRPADTIGELVTRLDAEPVSYDGPDGPEELTGDRFVTGLVTSLYDASVARPIELAVAALTDRDPQRQPTAAAFLGGLADRQGGRREDGRYGNAKEVQALVNCADADAPLDAEDAAALDRRRADGGGVLAAVLDPVDPSCVELPVNVGDTDVGSSDAAGRILIVGTTGDPATPVEWASELGAALGGAPVLVYEGRGHTATLRIACVTAMAVETLVDGEAPTSPAPCPVDPAEEDVYAVAAEQIEAMGLPEGAGECVADALRGQVDPLMLVADEDALDPSTLLTVQRAVLSCRRGG